MKSIYFIMNRIYAFFITFIAGLSTSLGVIPIYFKINNKYILNTFKFSFLVLLVISIGELIPDGYILISRYFNAILSIMFVILFLFIGFLLTKLVDSKVGEGTNTFYRVGIVSMFALVIHNLLEGIITYVTATNDLKLGILISISIIFHNIPEGLLIAIPIYKAKKRRGLALFLTLFSGMSEFLGAILSYLFLGNYINDLVLGIIYVITAGIMIYVALVEILPIILKFDANTQKWNV